MRGAEYYSETIAQPLMIITQNPRPKKERIEKLLNIHVIQNKFKEWVENSKTWWLAVGGLVWIIIGAILIGRDWEDIKNGQFFNTEEE